MAMNGTKMKLKNETFAGLTREINNVYKYTSISNLLVSMECVTIRTRVFKLDPPDNINNYSDFGKFVYM